MFYEILSKELNINVDNEKGKSTAKFSRRYIPNINRKWKDYVRGVPKVMPLVYFYGSDNRYKEHN